MRLHVEVTSVGISAGDPVSRIQLLNRLIQLPSLVRDFIANKLNSGAKPSVKNIEATGFEKASLVSRAATKNVGLSRDARLCDVMPFFWRSNKGCCLTTLSESD